MGLLHRFRAVPGSRRAGSACRRTSNVSPAGVCQIPVMIASCSSRRSKRFRGDGNGMPYAACSCSAQPAPSANVMRPPLMASTWATVIASGPGSRNVADAHQGAEPDPLGLARQAGEGDPGVGRPGQRRRVERQVVVGAHEVVEAEPPRWPARRGAGRRSSRPAAARSSRRSSSRDHHSDRSWPPTRRASSSRSRSLGRDARRVRDRVGHGVEGDDARRHRGGVDRPDEAELHDAPPVTGGVHPVPDPGVVVGDDDAQHAVVVGRRPGDG